MGKSGIHFVFYWPRVSSLTKEWHLAAPFRITLEEMVIISFSMSESSKLGVECHARHDYQIETVSGEAVSPTGNLRRL